MALLPFLCGCSSDPLLVARFTDTFERAEIGADYANTGAPYRIEQGELAVANAHNHPLWLKRRLPPNVQIDLDCRSKSPDGDIKLEIFGDGRSFQPQDDVARDLAYTASGYVVIFGGWKNQMSLLARQSEHGHGGPTRPLPKVEPGRRYHFTIVRRGSVLDWSIDGQPFLHYVDPSPLAGKGQDHIGLSGWETEVTFDNLVVTPL